MDTAWIPIFVLSLSECVAPAGKTVCQEQQLEMQFVTRQDCELALSQLVSLKEASEAVIVDKAKSRCYATAKESPVFRNADEAGKQLAAAQDWRAPRAEESATESMPSAHQERLASLPACEDNGGVAPCKVGEIIVEGATQKPLEVWRRDD